MRGQSNISRVSYTSMGIAKRILSRNRVDRKSNRAKRKLIGYTRQMNHPQTVVEVPEDSKGLRVGCTIPKGTRFHLEYKIVFGPNLSKPNNNRSLLKFRDNMYIDLKTKFTDPTIEYSTDGLCVRRFEHPTNCKLYIKDIKYQKPKVSVETLKQLEKGEYITARLPSDFYKNKGLWYSPGKKTLETSIHVSLAAWRVRTGESLDTVMKDYGLEKKLILQQIYKTQDPREMLNDKDGDVVERDQYHPVMDGERISFDLYSMCCTSLFKFEGVVWDHMNRIRDKYISGKISFFPES